MQPKHMYEDEFVISNKPLPEKLRDFLLKLNDQTRTKCAKIIEKIQDQERHFTIAVVPDAERKAAQMRGAYQTLDAKFRDLQSIEGLNVYWESSLRQQKGLYFRIYRGKLNRYLVPKIVSRNGLESKESIEAQTQYRFTH